MASPFEIDPLAGGHKAELQRLREIARVMTAQHHTAEQIAAQVGRCSRTIVRWRSAYGWISPLQPHRSRGENHA